MKKRAATYLLPIAIILIGLCFRAYRPDLYPFGFDQIQILENAHKILAGDLSLIGPRTGPADMYTGPLIYYLAVPFVSLLDSPYALVILALFCAAITGTALYLLTRNILPQTTALLLLLLWACSPFLIGLDRVPWNPNLSILAASLVFFPFLKRNPAHSWLSPTDQVCIATGVFLGYQAHFSGLSLIGLALLGWFLYARKQWHLPLVLVCSWVLSLVPTVIFDFRHQWLNAHGLAAFATSADHVSRFQSLSRLLKTGFITLENLGKIVIAGNQTGTVLLAGGLMFALYARSLKKSPNWWPIIWLLPTVIAFSLYRGSLPEYYFLMQIPSLLYITATAIALLLTTKPLRYLAAAALIAGGATATRHLTIRSSLSLGEQVILARQLKHSAPHVGPLIYDMKPVDAQGLTYLLKNTTFGATTNPVHIIYPYTPFSPATKRTHTAAYWIDERTDTASNYLLSDSYLMRTPTSVRVYQSLTLPTLYTGTTTFLVTVNDYTAGFLEVVPYASANLSDRNSRLIAGCISQKDGFMEVDGFSFYRKCAKPLVLLYMPKTTTDTRSVEELLGTLTITVYDALSVPELTP